MTSCWLSNDKGFEENTSALLYRHGSSYVGLGETVAIPSNIVSSIEGECKAARTASIGSIDMRWISRTDVKCGDGPHSDPGFERRVRETRDQFVRDLRGLNLTCVRT